MKDSAQSYIDLIDAGTVKLKSGKKITHWYLDSKPDWPFNCNETIYICHNAVAEVSCMLQLGMARPNNLWDTMVQDKKLWLGRVSGFSLLDSCKRYQIPTITEAQKEIYRKLIINKYPAYSAREKQKIIEYNITDVEENAKLFMAQCKEFDFRDKNSEKILSQAIFHCRSQGVIAKIERNGIPIDTALVNKFNTYWPMVKDELVREVNLEIDVFNEDLTFSHTKFNELIKRNNLGRKWPRMKSGNFTTNKKIIKQNLDNKEIEKFNEIRTLQNMTKLTAYTPGNDGRTRTSFNMFGTVTGRTSPSSSKYVFSASKWARNFIKPSLGNYLVYLDYKSQEPAIMGYLSGDQNKIKAYQSGDIYIHTAKLFDFLPPEVVRDKKNKEREEVRNTFKVIDLANTYGQGPGAVAESLKCSVSHANFLMNKYTEIFKVYFRWIDGFIENSLNKTYFSTCYGWQRHIKSLFTTKEGKKKHIHKSLLNWPIQAHGGEILRQALIDLTDENFKVVALVHDAVMLEIPIPEFKQRLEEAKQIMVDASIKVVGGPITVDQEIIKSNYEQEFKDQKLFNKIMSHIDRYTRSRLNVPTDRVHRPI